MVWLIISAASSPTNIYWTSLMQSFGSNMSEEAQKAEIIRLVKEIADRDGGIPPGQQKFTKETGILPHIWRAKLWRTWSNVLIEAGFARNKWTIAISDAEIFAAVGSLAHKLEKFPNTTDLQVERAQNPQFPDQKTISRRKSMAELAQEVRLYAERHNDDVLVAMCKAYLNENPVTRPKPPTPDISQIGHVYLIQYGKDYKIGRTLSLSRRSREIQIELPETTEFIHSILTDDPVGVENYWHRRFSEYRKNGEWFRLPPKAVTAFKRWKKIA